MELAAFFAMIFASTGHPRDLMGNVRPQAVAGMLISPGEVINELYQDLSHFPGAPER